MDLEAKWIWIGLSVIIIGSALFSSIDKYIEKDEVKLKLQIELKDKELEILKLKEGVVEND